MSTGINPYTPPTVQEAVTEPGDAIWYVSEHAIHVRDGALLPRVDLQTGSTDPALAVVGRKYVIAHWSMSSIGLGPLLFLILLKLKKWDAIPAGISITIISTIWLTAYLMIYLTLTRRVTFTTYAQPTEEARRKRNRNIRGTLYPLSLVLLVSSMYLLSKDTTADQTTALTGVIVLSVIVLIALSLWQYKERPTIIMSMGSNGWLKLAGVHPDAIRHMEKQDTTHTEIP
jgi:hypothetical protein